MITASDPYLRDWIEREEGRRAAPYRCSADYITAGIGHNLEVHYGQPRAEQMLADMLASGDKFTPAQIDDWYDQDLTDALDGARRLLGGTHPDEVWRVLAAMVFQLGERGVRGFPSMLRALDARRYAEAAVHALDSKWHREDTPDRAVRTGLRLAKVADAR